MNDCPSKPCVHRFIYRFYEGLGLEKEHERTNEEELFPLKAIDRRFEELNDEQKKEMRERNKDYCSNNCPKDNE